jgi:two-component system nitrate/nitrite response regulator NarL
VAPVTLVVAEDHEVTMHGLIGWFQQSDQFLILGKSSDKNEIAHLVAEHQPDVVILDLHLDGNKPLAELIKDICRVGSKIVVFSAENRLFYVNLAMENGVSAFLLKSEPFARVAEVLQLVTKGQTGILSNGLNAKHKLTPTEQDILRLLSRGMKYDQIAVARATTSETIRKQCDKMILKLGLRNREQMTAWGTRNGFANDESANLSEPT